MFNKRKYFNMTKKEIKETLKELKNDLLNNPYDYTMIDLYDNKTPKAVLTDNGKIKFINPSYKNVAYRKYLF